MAEFNNAQFVGDFSVAVEVSDTESSKYSKLRRNDGTLGYPGHAEMHAHPNSHFVVDLVILTAANNNTKGSAGWKAPFPVRILAIDVAAETVADAAGTIDVKVDGASILDAPESVKATLTVPKRVLPEDGSEEVAYGSVITIEQTTGAGGNMVGGQAHILMQRI